MQTYNEDLRNDRSTNKTLESFWLELAKADYAENHPIIRDPRSVYLARYIEGMRLVWNHYKAIQEEFTT